MQFLRNPEAFNATTKSNQKFSSAVCTLALFLYTTKIDAITGLVIFPTELLQLQMRILLPFILTKNIHRFLLLMRTCSFLTLFYVGGTYARLVYTWYKNIFYMIAVLMVYPSENDKRQKWGDNNIKTRQRQDRDDTVLLFATQQQQNTDTRITILEHNFDDSERRSRSDTSTRQGYL